MRRWLGSGLAAFLLLVVAVTPIFAADPTPAPVGGRPRGPERPRRVRQQQEARGRRSRGGGRGGGGGEGVAPGARGGKAAGGHRAPPSRRRVRVHVAGDAATEEVAGRKRGEGE